MKNPLKEQSLGFSVFVVIILIVLFVLPYFFPKKDARIAVYTPVSFERGVYVDTNDIYDIQGFYPRTENESGRASDFNLRITSLLSGEVGEFIDASDDPIDDPELPKSSLTFDYETSQGNGIAQTLSFNFSQYIQGAAHPYSYIVTSSFDDITLEEVTLEDLFGTDLQALSEVIKDEIRKTYSPEDRDMFFQTSGLDPTHENYKNFIITETGITFVFNPYQIAPYVYGAISVPVSYEILSGIINPLFVPK